MLPLKKRDKLGILLCGRRFSSMTISATFFLHLFYESTRIADEPRLGVHGCGG
jgi:hypothetical protein